MLVTLYGDLGRNFDAEKVVKQGREVSIVAVFAGMLVQLYNGLNYTLLYAQPNYCVLLSLFSRSHLTTMHLGARAPRKVWSELTQMIYTWGEILMKVTYITLVQRYLFYVHIVWLINPNQSNASHVSYKTL